MRLFDIDRLESPSTSVHSTAGREYQVRTEQTFRLQYHNSGTPRFIPQPKTVQSVSRMPAIKIYYFDFPFWRAEVARLALHLGNVSCHHH